MAEETEPVAETAVGELGGDADPGRDSPKSEWSSVDEQVWRSDPDHLIFEQIRSLMARDANAAECVEFLKPHLPWSSAVGILVHHLVVNRMLGREQILDLMAATDGKGYSWRELSTGLILLDLDGCCPDLSLIERFLGLRADWVLLEYLPVIPLMALESVKVIITTSSRPRGVRNELCSAVAREIANRCVGRSGSSGD